MTASFPFTRPHAGFRPEWRGRIAQNMDDAPPGFIGGASIPDPLVQRLGETAKG
jgi:hypothetical protein